jgi:hypothetical protein
MARKKAPAADATLVAVLVGGLAEMRAGPGASMVGEHRPVHGREESREASREASREKKRRKEEDRGAHGDVPSR